MTRMGVEEQEILNKIQHLSGRIDRRKQRQRASFQPPKATDSDGGGTSDASASSWITKTDRHIQLINPSAYKGGSHPRNGSTDPARARRYQPRGDRGKTRLSGRIHGAEQGVGNSPGAVNADAGSSKYTVVVDGARFLVVNSGKKLIKLPGEPSQTPQNAVVSGAKFRRTKNGNLVRVAWQRRLNGKAGTAKLDVPCKFFSTTGSCPAGPGCRYQHDAAKVAICKAMLQGHCLRGESCDLSHDPTPERVPTCVHYAKGLCSNPDCLYAHVDLAPEARHCRPFGLYGYCDKGANCPERHSFECPDFSNTGSCNTKGCKLVHRERASVLRKAAAAAAAAAATVSGGSTNNSTDDGGASSDEAGELSDIDSDEADALTGPDQSCNNDFVNQRDFIGL